MTEPAPEKIYGDPGAASAESGQVLLDGPDGIAVALSPDAAEETARRLLAAAEAARGQASEGVASAGDG